MSDTILARLADLVGPDVFVGSSLVEGDDGLLAPEPDAITRAIPKRRAEFAAGRRAARAALAQAGLPPAPIPQGKDRAPIWPAGIVGSITHDNGLALAAVAQSAKVRRLGIDLAEATDFPQHLRAGILSTPAEHAQSGLQARVSFSAKESVFKAFYPEVNEYFGFDAVEVTPDLSTHAYCVELRRPLGAAKAGAVFEGRFAIASGRLIAVFVD